MQCSEFQALAPRVLALAVAKTERDANPCTHSIARLRAATKQLGAAEIETEYRRMCAYGGRTFTRVRGHEEAGPSLTTAETFLAYMILLQFVHLGRVFSTEYTESAMFTVRKMVCKP